MSQTFELGRERDGDGTAKSWIDPGIATPRTIRDAMKAVIVQPDRTVKVQERADPDCGPKDIVRDPVPRRHRNLMLLGRSSA
jgi:hypothetical protein